MQTANEKRLYRLVFDEIHKVITDIGYRDVFNLFPRLNMAGVSIFGSSASIPDHLILALFQLTNTPWKVIRTPSNRKELVYEVRKVPKEVEIRDHVVDFWKSIHPTYGPSDRCVVFCRTIDESKKLAELLNCLPFHSECVDEEPVQKFREGEQKILPTTIRLGCGFHYENIRHVIHMDLAYSIIDQYQEDSRGGRDGRPCQAITFVKDDRVCPPDKGSFDIGVQAVWEWSRKDNQCLRIIPSQFLDGAAVTCDLVTGGQLCVVCQKESVQEPPPKPVLLPVRPILRLSETPSHAVTPLYTPQGPRQPTYTPAGSRLSAAAFQTPLRNKTPAPTPSHRLERSSPPPIPSSPPVLMIGGPIPVPTDSHNKRRTETMIFNPPSKRSRTIPENEETPRYFFYFNVVLYLIFYIS
jgi:hypothetical protein